MERSIEATTTIRADFERAREVLAEDPGCLFSDQGSSEERRAQRFRVGLTVDVGTGTSVQQDVEVQLGTAPSNDDSGVVLPVSWHATGHERFFPTFDGQLEAAADGVGTQLRLTGTYKVPFGVVGRFGDGLAGRRLARRSLGALVERIARRLDAEVAHRLQSGSWRPAPYPVSLSEHSPSDIYLG